MRLFTGLVIWLVVLLVYPALAVAALVLYPVIWLLLLPLRLLGVCVDAVFALLKALLFLPARLLGGARASL